MDASEVYSSALDGSVEYALEKFRDELRELKIRLDQAESVLIDHVNGIEGLNGRVWRLERGLLPEEE